MDHPSLCYLGHAGFALSHSGTCLLMDPWLSGKGAFLRTWFPFPDNTGLSEPVLSYARDYQLFVYVSHSHEDHCDLEFLERLDSLEPTYVLPRYVDSSLERRLASLRGSKIFMGDGEELALGPEFRVKLFLEESGINADSAVLTWCGGNTFFNLNDCKIFDRVPVIIREEIDVLTCQFSGANWHPLCYEYDEMTYQRISLKKKNSKFLQVLRLIRAVQPGTFIPSAGPAVFLHPVLYARNSEPLNIFPRTEEFVSYLAPRIGSATKIQIMQPGESMELGTGEVSRLFAGSGIADLETYRRSKEFLHHRAPRRDLDFVLEQLLTEVQKKLALFETTLTTKFMIIFGVMGAPRQLLIDLNARCATLVSRYLPQEYTYQILADPEAAAALVANEIEWGDFCLSFLLSIRRDPDEYCTLVNLFFVSTPESLKSSLRMLEEFRSNETRIEIAARDGRFTCRRYCPHQGADLTYGYAEDGFWVCPRHRWRYDLSRGGFSEDRSCSIDAIRVEAPEQV